MGSIPKTRAGLQKLRLELFAQVPTWGIVFVKISLPYKSVYITNLAFLKFSELLEQNSEGCDFPFVYILYIQYRSFYSVYLLHAPVLAMSVKLVGSINVLPCMFWQYVLQAAAATAAAR